MLAPVPASGHEYFQLHRNSVGPCEEAVAQSIVVNSSKFTRLQMDGGSTERNLHEL